MLNSEDLCSHHPFNVGSQSTLAQKGKPTHTEYCQKQIRTYYKQQPIKK